MTPRRLGLAVFAWPVAVAAATGTRAVPGLVVVPMLVAGLAARSRTVAGLVYAGTIVAGAWVTAAGPWQGEERQLVVAVLATVAGTAVLVVARRTATLASIAAAALVAASALVVVAPPTAGPVPVDPDLVAVDDYVRDEVSDGQLPGVAVAVVRDGRIVFARGYGTVGGQPMTPATRVVIGSTSKSMTALATLRLAEQGRLGLDDRIDRHLPWFDPVDERARAITVRQLLTDTSGIPTWAGWALLAGDGRRHPNEVRHLLQSIHLTGSPGGTFRYSNANYILLGLVLEAAAGEPYGDVIRETVTEPIGMTDTLAGPPAAHTSYRFWFGVPVPSHLPYLEVGQPAGAVSATAADLGAYLAAQLGKRPALGRELVDTWHQPAVEAEGFGVPAGRHYALGWYVGTVAGEPAVFHAGDVFDSSSSLIMIPGEDLGVVVVATTSSAVTPVAKSLGEGVTTRLLHQRASNTAAARALATVAAVAVAAAVLAFASARALALRRRTAGWTTRATARVVLVDLILPAAVLFGLPVLFSTELDRAETLAPTTFWRLAERGLPDVMLLVLLGLVVRLGAGLFALASRLRRP